MLRMWMYDLAREQTPTAEHLDRLCRVSLDSGYDALGLYLEHRFVYASAPWAAGREPLTPETVVWLRREYPSLRLVPFVNLLGHMEGFLYTTGGEELAEERFAGMQACPSNPNVAAFARGLLDDVLNAFDDELVHIGGDETQQLGVCPECRTKDKADLYGGYFGPMARYVLERGRRPAVWSDMFLEHPSALERMPKETLVFDWQYFASPRETSKKFIDAGHEVVVCPTVHVYNAPWCHLPETEGNVREHVEAAKELNAFGVCVTTWEGALFANYETLLPAIAGCGELLNEGGRTARVSAPDGDRLLFDGDPELPDAHAEDREGGSQAVEITSTIVTQLLRRSERRLELCLVPNMLKILSDGKDSGQLSLDLAPDVLGRLSLLAGMDPLKHHQPRRGVISGTYAGEAFRLQAASYPLDEGIVFVLENGRITLDSTGSSSGAKTLLKAYLKTGERHEEWARLMGVELQEAGGIFAFSKTRSPIKARLLLYSNPFLLWLRNREDLVGEPGTKALSILDRAIAFAPDSSYRGVSEFVKIAIETVRHIEAAAKAYAAHRPGEANAALAPIRPAMDDLARIAKGNHLRFGGSQADISRCIAAKEHVERVMRRIKQYGDGSLGYLPSFETICHPKFIPHDQGNWWLINRWANE